MEWNALYSYNYFQPPFHIWLYNKLAHDNISLGLWPNFRLKQNVDGNYDIPIVFTDIDNLLIIFKADSGSAPIWNECLSVKTIWHLLCQTTVPDLQSALPYINVSTFYNSLIHSGVDKYASSLIFLLVEFVYQHNNLHLNMTRTYYTLIVQVCLLKETL